MTLKKISRKKMSEVIDKVINRIYKGDFSNVLETLEKYKMDIHTVDAYGCTFLWAVGTHLLNKYPPKWTKNVVTCMQFLIDHGADVNYRNNFGETVLFLVAGNDRSNPEAVEMLIQNGADVNCLNENGDSPLVKAIASFEDKYPETITPLLKAGADPYLKLNKEKKGFDTLEELIDLQMRMGKGKNTQLKTTFLKAMKDLGRLET